MGDRLFMDNERDGTDSTERQDDRKEEKNWFDHLFSWFDQSESKVEHASLGILRLDYDYPAAKGDIDHPDSFNYDVYYRAVPGLTFEMCQDGNMTKEVETCFLDAIEWLNQKGVN